MERSRLFSVSLFVLILAVGSVNAAPNTGAIWTTRSDCGAMQQDENHFSVGDHVYIHGAGFRLGTSAWAIVGKPGHASTDPNVIVAQGNITINSTGSFCFDAYTVTSGDSGEYGASVGRKSDNYRVMGADLSCEDAIGEGLLTGHISGNSATVDNAASNTYLVSFVSYQMYSGGNVFDQTAFDWRSASVGANQSKTLTLQLPHCAYQVDLVCGKPILGAPYYGGRIIASTVQNQGTICTPSDSSSEQGISASVSVAPYFPQERDYVFFCDVQGFNATSYSWYYGDGETLVESTLDNVYHTYNSSGRYSAACRATNGTSWAVGTLEVDVI